MIKVKICGLTNLEDAVVATEAGADLLGFIFYKPSPRYIAPDKVREIVSSVRYQVSGSGDCGSAAKGQDTNVGILKKRETQHATGTPATRSTQRTLPQFVGVFVNTPLVTVRQILDFCQLDAVQLHGEETPKFVHHFDGRAFKALRPKSQAEADASIRKYLPCSSVPLHPCFLIDAYHPTLYGGTGRITDWTLAANIAQQYPILLAGSLTPANVLEAVRAVQPWGVDVSSGVEREKGHKDHEKVREFIKAARNGVHGV